MMNMIKVDHYSYFQGKIYRTQVEKENTGPQNSRRYSSRINKVTFESTN